MKQRKTGLRNCHAFVALLCPNRKREQSKLRQNKAPPPPIPQIWREKEREEERFSVSFLFYFGDSENVYSNIFFPPFWFLLEDLVKGSTTVLQI